MIGPVAAMEDLQSLLPEEASGLLLAPISQKQVPEGRTMGFLTG